MGHYWHLFWHIENGAQRLACFGLGVMIAWLLWLRHRDRRTGRELAASERAVQSIAPPLVWIVSMLFAGLILVITARAIVGRFPQWLVDPEPAPTHMMFIPINMIAVVLIERLAYHPVAKLRWCAGWIVFAHIVQWGGFFFGHR